MIVDATIAGRTRRIEITGTGESMVVLVEGHPALLSAINVSPHSMHLTVDGRSYDLGIVEEEAAYRVTGSNASYRVEVEAVSASGAPMARKKTSGPAAVRSPMPGKIVRVLVAEGASVAEGTGLLVIEAMKMENEIRSPRAGIVRGVSVREGQAVETGATLCVLE